jgi:hypothetical protein
MDRWMEGRTDRLKKGDREGSRERDRQRQIRDR